MSRNRLADITAQLAVLIDAGTDGALIAPVRELATRLGTSHVTVLRAIRQLKKSGRLLTRPGAGTFITARSDTGTPPAAVVPAPCSEPRGTRASRALNAFSADLGTGRYLPGEPLPMAKELCMRYGVCRATLRNVLMSLCRMERVQEHGRWWRVRSLAVTVGEVNTVACIVNVDADYGGVQQLPDRELSLLRAIETSVQRAGLMLRVHMARLIGNRFENVAGKEICEAVLADHERLYGIVYLTMGFDLDNRGLAVVRTLAQSAFPVAVIDENGFFTAEKLTDLSRNVRLFTQAVSRRSGLLVGRYLSTLGHRRIAYIDDGWGSVWSDNRFAGLQQAFMEVGADKAVRKIAFGCGVRKESLSADLWNLLDTGSTPQSVRDLARALMTLTGQVDALFSQYGLERALAPYLKDLINDVDVTCWVCANDLAGTVAQRFLAGNGIEMPRQLSMIAFDDTILALNGRFTSYSFNPEGMALACIGHITNHPLWRRMSGEQAIVEIDGHVHDRGTVRRVSMV